MHLRINKQNLPKVALLIECFWDIGFRVCFPKTWKNVKQRGCSSYISSDLLWNNKFSYFYPRALYISLLSTHPQMGDCCHGSNIGFCVLRSLERDLSRQSFGHSTAHSTSWATGAIEQECWICIAIFASVDGQKKTKKELFWLIWFQLFLHSLSKQTTKWQSDSLIIFS